MKNLFRVYDPLSVASKAMTEYKARRQDIANNRDLSPEGKAAAYKKLESDPAYQSKAHSELQAELRLLRQDKGEVDEKKQDAAESGAARWDPTRLLAAQAETRSRIQAAADLDEATRIYNREMQSGDMYTQRAWAAIGPGEIISRFGQNIETAQFKRQAQADFERLTSTPEKAEAQEYESELADRMLAYRAAAEAAANTFYPNAQPGEPNEFTELVAAVQVRQKIDPERVGVLLTSVDISDAPEGAA